MEHISEDGLERYAMQTLPESEAGPLEGHLLVCGDCRERLQTMDEYLAAMRSAAAKIRERGKGN